MLLFLAGVVCGTVGTIVIDFLLELREFMRAYGGSGGPPIERKPGWLTAHWPERF